MTLAQMQARFFELKGKLAVGQIQEEEFKRELEKLRFQDAYGRWWMIGAQSGRWYYYDGVRWLLGDPPEPSTSGPPQLGILRDGVSPIVESSDSRDGSATRPYTSRSPSTVVDLSLTQPSATTAAPSDAPSPTSDRAGCLSDAGRAITRRHTMPIPADMRDGASLRTSPSNTPSRTPPSHTTGTPPPPPVRRHAVETDRHSVPTTGNARVGAPPLPPRAKPSDKQSPGLQVPSPHRPSPLVTDAPSRTPREIGILRDGASPHAPSRSSSRGGLATRSYPSVLILLGAVIIGLALVALMWLVVDNFVPGKPISSLLARSLGGNVPTRVAVSREPLPVEAGQNVELLLQVGDELVSKSQFEPALEQYRAAARYAPDEADVYTHWARALALTGRIADAITHAQRATKLDPTSARAFAELARTLAWAGQTNAAINAGEKAVALDPQNATAHAFLAEAYLRAGRNNEAQAEADTAVELDDANPETHRAAGWVAILANRKDEGVGEWMRVVELAPEIFFYHYEFGQVYMNYLNDPQMAISAYQRAIQLYPSYVPSYLALGRAFLATNQPGPAILQFQKALTLDPRSSEAMVGLGQAFQHSQKCPQAIPYFQKALELNQNLVAANKGLADCGVIAQGPVEPPPATPTRLAAIPTAVVQATVAPLAVSTPTPKSSGVTTASPAGTGGSGTGRILFPVYDGQYRIYSANPDGSDRRLIAELASSPAFSPDGSQILYYSWQSDQRGIHRIAADGAGDQHISLRAEDTLPSWSPDGTKYIYATRAGQGSDINRRAYTLRVANTGAKPRQDPPPLVEQAQYPAWGPNGRIVFRDCGYPEDVCGLAVINADGSGKKMLTNINSTAPSWSPDGNWILFMSNAAGNWDIYVVSADGGSPIRLTDEFSDEGLPVYSPDGKKIAFVAYRDNRWSIWQMDADGEHEIKLFDLGGELAGPVRGNVPAQPGQVWLEQKISWR